MSKVKDAVEEFRQKLLDKKKQEDVTESVKEEVKFTQTAFDVIRDPTKTNRAYLIVKIEYDIASKQAKVVDTVEFHDKTAALSMLADKDNRRYFFERKS